MHILWVTASVVRWIVESLNCRIGGDVKWRLAANAVFKELNLNSNAEILFGTCAEWQRRWQQIIFEMFSPRKCSECVKMRKN